jgi:predicted dehydrogenase
VTVRVGVIGAGAWATTSHLPTLMRRGDEIELVAVCRRGDPQLRVVAKEFGFPIASEDYRVVLDSGVDMCIVSSPAALHYEHAKAALQAGCHVLLEKPVTLNPAHAWELVRIAETLNRHVVVSFGWNFMETYQKASALWESQPVGEVEHVMLHMASGIRELLLGTGVSSTGNPDDEADTRTYTDPALAGGGYGQTQLSHAFGWLLGLTGLRGDRIYATGSFPQGNALEIHLAATVSFLGGATGSISGASYHAGAMQNRHQLEVRVFGSRGQLHADLERDRLWVWSEGSETDEGLAENAGRYHCEGPPLALLDLIQGRTEINPAPLALGARTVELLHAMGESMRTAEPVSVRTAPHA